MNPLLRLLRVLVRPPTVALATLGCYLPLLAGWLLLAPWPARRLAWGNRVFRVWSRLLGRIAGMRVEVVGRPPRRPFLLVANHVGYADILLLGGAAGGVFVAKREIASWPVMGHLCRLVGTVFVDREAKRDLLRVGRQIEGALGRGLGVVLFPEGTTADGQRLLPFRPSLLAGAAAAARPVHWATVAYATAPGLPPADRAVAWTGGAPLVRHLVHLLSLPGFRGRVSFGTAPVTEADRKRLAARLRSEMSRDLGHPTPGDDERSA